MPIGARAVLVTAVQVSRLPVCTLRFQTRVANTNGNGKTKISPNLKCNTSGKANTVRRGIRPHRSAMTSEHDDERDAMAIFGLEHSTHDPKGSSLSGREKAQYELGLGRWSERTDVLYKECGNLPAFAQGDPVAFFAAADECERVNGRRYTEVVLTMASELSDEDNWKEGQKWVRVNLGTSHPYILAFHKPERLRSDPKAQEELAQLRAKPGVTEEEIRKAEQQMFQPHIHVLFCERTITPENAGLSPEKWYSRKGATKDRQWHDKDLIPRLREAWSQQVNEALDEHAPDAQRVDHRSLKVQRAEALQNAIREAVELHKLPEEERRPELQRLAVRVAVLDRVPEGRMSGIERSLAKKVTKKEEAKPRRESKRQQRGKDLREALGVSFEKRGAEPTPEAIEKAVKQIAESISTLSKMREACFAAVQFVREVSRELRNRLKAQRHAAELNMSVESIAAPAPMSAWEMRRERRIKHAAEIEKGSVVTVDRDTLLQDLAVLYGGKQRGADLLQDWEGSKDLAASQVTKDAKDMMTVTLKRREDGRLDYAVKVQKGKEAEIAKLMQDDAMRAEPERKSKHRKNGRERNRSKEGKSR